MRALVWSGLGAVALLLIDRLLLAAEARGWIYWRRRRASAGTLGDAMVRLQALVEPGVEQRLGPKEEKRDEREPGGAPPGALPAQPPLAEKRAASSGRPQAS